MQRFHNLQIADHYYDPLWAALHRNIFAGLIAVLSLAVLPFSGSAAIISFSPAFVGGSQWKYDYTVTVPAGDPSVDEFSIFFHPALYENLAVAATPLGWGPLVIQPNTGIPADGFFDALAVDIGPGTSQGGFTVSFDFLGTGTPGAQRFDIVDSNTFAKLQTGFTSAAVVTAPSDVTEPNTLTLIGIGIALFLSFRSRSPQTTGLAESQKAGAAFMRT